MPDSVNERLRQARLRAGFERAVDAARRHGWREPTYLAHENGSRGLTRESAVRYAKAFRVTTDWLLHGRGDFQRRPVPVAGILREGIVLDLDQAETIRLEEVTAPPGIGPDAFAVIVRGDSCYPRYADGDALICDRWLDPAEADGAECIVETVGGDKLLRTIRRQPDGRWTLETFNAPPIRDVELARAAPVMWVKR